MISPQKQSSFLKDLNSPIPYNKDKIRQVATNFIDEPLHQNTGGKSNEA